MVAAVIFFLLIFFFPGIGGILNTTREMIRAGSSRRENRSEKKSLVDGGMRVDRRRRRKELTSLVQRHEKIEKEKRKREEIYIFK